MTYDDGSDERGQDDPEGTLSRRGFGRIVAGVLGVLGVHTALDSPSVAAKRKKRRKGKGKNGNACPPGRDDGSSASLDPEEQAFLGLINEYRVANGRKRLTHNAQLGAAAQAHSLDMGTRNYYDHNSPEGVTPRQRISRQGYCAQAGWGENINADHDIETAAATFQEWKDSPPHNKNMLDPDFEEIGIGRAFVAGSEWSWYWTTNFGDRDWN